CVTTAGIQYALDS
nr:immunoglobulin heavy chain junction region [Macaca mulatta]